MPPCVAVHCHPAARGIGAYSRPTSTTRADHSAPTPFRPARARARDPAGVRARPASCASARSKAGCLGQGRRSSARRVCSPRVQADDAAERATAEADPLEQFARIDHGRQARTGMPEVVYGQGKTPQQIAAILTAMGERAGQSGGQGGGQRVVMATRVDAEAAQQVCALLPSAIYHPLARVLHLPLPLPPAGGAEASEAGESESGAGSAAENVGDSGGGREGASGHVMVVTAGTTDLPVAEEARVTLELMGVPVSLIADVGVAGLHRVITQLPRIRQAAVVIVVAGMDGALPSVISGLVDMPVIAVPTSVGYGASFGGVAALLAALNACAPGVTVVNIDNGFGAAAAAARILLRSQS
ncbi:unnamed protein product [Closterium sp. Yama58-4]|nr:unnamed protein product [Closterium sp. Yama58-4]